MYDARHLRRMVISPTPPNKRSTNHHNSQHPDSTDHNNNNNNMSSINAPHPNTPASASASSTSNPKSPYSIHTLLPRMAGYLAVALLSVASLMVLITLSQESMYMTKLTSSYNAVPPHTSTSTSSSISSYLQQKGTESICDKTASNNNNNNKNNNRNGLETLHPPMPTQHELTEFLEGPALDPRIMSMMYNAPTTMIVAACKFQPDTHSPHFPHALQQIYRCVSWWQYHREKVANHNNNNNINNHHTLELYLIWPRKAAVKSTAVFLNGFLAALRQTWNVKIVPLRGTAQIVRAKVQYGYLQDFVALEGSRVVTNNHNNDNHTITTSAQPQSNEQPFLPQSGGNLGSLLPTKTTNLGYQTRQVSDLQQLRNDMIQSIFPNRFAQEQQQLRIPITPSSKPQGQQQSPIPPPKITILNRLVESGRSILNGAELYQALQQQQHPNITGGMTVEYIPHFDNVTFLEQVRILSETDILISPHGAQLSSLFLLPKCASVLEVFGRGYFCPEFFGSLAAASGIRYHYLYTGAAAAKHHPDNNHDATPATRTSLVDHNNNKNNDDEDDDMDHDRAAELRFWMKDLQSRTVARLFPICAPIDIIVQYVQDEIQAWQRRMQNPSQNCL